MELRRLLQNILVKILARLVKKDEEYLKSKLFRIYVHITGHHCQNINEIEKSGYVGHFNVMPPLKLIKSISEAGFQIVIKRQQVLVPIVARPFRKGRWTVSLFLNLEHWLRHTPFLPWILFSNIGILAKKIV